MGDWDVSMGLFRQGGPLKLYRRAKGWSWGWGQIPLCSGGADTSLNASLMVSDAQEASWYPPSNYTSTVVTQEVVSISQFFEEFGKRVSITSSMKVQRNILVKLSPGNFIFVDF